MNDEFQMPDEVDDALHEFAANCGREMRRQIDEDVSNVVSDLGASYFSEYLDEDDAEEDAELVIKIEEWLEDRLWRKIAEDFEHHASGGR